MTRQENQCSIATYNPNDLIDGLIALLKLKNDAALCRLLGVSRPVISRIRHRTLPVTASILLKMHEETGLSVGELRNLLGDRRSRFRFGHTSDRPTER